MHYLYAPFRVEASQYVDSFIRTAAVDNDVLKIGIILIENRQNCFFQEAALIERRRNDA